jgi:hypothetical protein
MNDPFLVPCLVTLRAEFNAVAPHRDKGADGWIGNRAHQQESSDHNPDETGNTPYEDADDVDEVHATDIDSTGPWPDGKGGEAGGWFDLKVRAIAAQERVEFESKAMVGRLQNIIWRGQIISRSWKWSEWRKYSGPSDHFDHAHFSARYLTSTENDTRPWGVEEDDMPLNSDDKAWLTEEIRGQVAKGVNDWISRANRAANNITTVVEGKTTRTLTDFELAGDRQILGMLRNTVGGPLTALEVASALEQIGQLPAGMSADEVAELVVEKIAARVAS